MCSQGQTDSCILFFEAGFFVVLSSTSHGHTELPPTASDSTVQSNRPVPSFDVSLLQFNIIYYITLYFTNK